MGVPAEVAAARESDRFGKFVRTAQIGSGGMGEVWKAWDVELGRWVALKFLRAGQTDEIARFKREAQTAAKLSHPNIAAIYEVSEDRGHHFIAMQFIDGVTLKKVPKRDRNVIAGYVRDAARAVGYGHSQGIIHRDLKPENVMVADGHVFVTDFGLARPAHGATQLTRTGDVVGTPDYMSPEQAGGEPLDAGTDVWSLGATLYELLAGGPPFHGANSLDTMLRIREEEPVPPRKSDPTIDADLETIVLKCLEKPRDRRYVTATALAADLDRWIRREPILARRAGVLTLVGRRLSRKKAAVTLAAVAALALIVGAGGVWLLRAKDRRLAEQQEALRRRESELIAALRRTAEATLEAALAVRRNGDLPGMLKHAERLREDCERVLRELPRAAEPHCLMGRMARALLRDADALAHQEKALALDPGLASARYERAILNSLEYGRLHQRAIEDARSLDGAPTAAAARALAPPSRADIERADPRLAALRKAVEQDARWLAQHSGIDDSAARTVQGVLAFYARDFDVASHDLRTAVDLDPLREEAWAMLGLALLERSRAVTDATQHEARLDDAIRTFAEAARRDRGYLPAVSWLAEVHAARGRLLAEFGRDPSADWSAAEKAYDEALALAPTDADGLNGRGRVRSSRGLWSMGRGGDPEPAWRDAEADFEAALRHDSGDLRARCALAALEGYRAVLEIYRGGNPLPSMTRGEFQLTEALALRPGHDALLTQRAGIRVNRALFAIRARRDPIPDFAAAEEDFTEAIRRNRESYSAWLGRSTLRTNRGAWRDTQSGDPDADYAAAEEDVGEAIRINPNTPDPWRARARLRTNRGVRTAARNGDPRPDWTAAEEDFDQALRRNPSDAQNWCERAEFRRNRALWFEGRDDDAARREFAAATQDYEAALRLNAHLEQTIRPWLEECRKKSR
jgi:serine/threonine-protein kinase